MPKPVNDLVMIEFNKLKEMNPRVAEYSILLQYLNYVVNLPWDLRTKETLDLKKAKTVKKI